jgi:uncharacterized protein YwqG
MNFEQLTELIYKHGLSKYEREILESVCPTIFLSLGKAGQSQCGQSRIGGVPDLPASITWPKSDRWQKHLCFLLQINCAQLPIFPGSPLPRQGMLYLFANDGDYDAEQIVFYDGIEPLQPANSPAADSLITDWYPDLVVHPLHFQLSPDIPRWATDDYQRLCDSLSPSEDRFDDIATDLSNGTIGKLLGHASGIGHDPRKDAYTVREGNPDWLYDYDKRKTLDMTRAYHWRNLLQIKSREAVNLCIGDAGYLQVLIHHDDLNQQNFSRVYVDFESS